MSKLIVHIEKGKMNYTYESQTAYEVRDSIIGSLNAVENGAICVTPSELNRLRNDLDSVNSLALGNPQLASEPAYWIHHKPVLTTFGMRYSVTKLGGVGHITVADFLDRFSKRRNFDANDPSFNRDGIYMLVFSGRPII